MEFFDINTVAFTLLGYPVSIIELVATIFGLISVYLATRPSILTWPTGIVNVIGFFILFFQYQLYADMLLQVYFFIVTLYGWHYWYAPKTAKPITQLSRNQVSLVITLLIFGTLTTGYFISRFHILLPTLFSEPASYPYIDAFTTVASILAMILLSRKIVESWILWIVVDVVCIGLYTAKSIMLVAIEYGVFLALATYGYIHWRGMIRD